MKITLSKNTVMFLSGVLVTIVYAFIGIPEIVLIYFLTIYWKELKALFSKSYEEVVEQGIYLIPLLGITVYRGIPLGNIYLALLSLYMMLFDKKIGIKKSVFRIYFIIILLDVIRYIVHIGESISIASVTSVPILYLCMFSGIVAYEICKSQNSITNRMISFIEGTLTSIAYGFVVRTRGGGAINAIINVSILNRNSGASGDPNYYGLYICIAVAFVVVLMGQYERYDLKLFGLVVGMLFMGLSSSSRMFYILATVCMGTLLVIMIKNLFDRKNQISILIVFVGLIVFLYFAKDVIGTNISYLLSRMDYSSTSKLTNGRSDLAQAYLTYMDTSAIRQIFGIGIAQYNLRSGIGHYAHNVYIELYVTMGILGFIVIVVVLINFLVKNFDVKNLKTFIVVIVLMLGGAAINYLEVDSFYILFALVAKMITYSKGVATHERKSCLDDYKFN